MTSTARSLNPWATDAISLAEGRRFRSNSIDEVHAFMSRTFCDHELRVEGGRSPLAFRHDQASLGAISFHITDYGVTEGRVHARVPCIDDMCLVQFLIGGRARINLREGWFELIPGRLSVVSTGTAIGYLFDKGSRLFTLKLPMRQLEALAASELGHSSCAIAFRPEPVPMSGAAGALAQFIRTICDDINDGGCGYAHPRLSRGVEDMLKRMLLLAAPHNHSEALQGPPTSPAPYYVRRVEDYVRAHAHEPIGLAEMARVSGVSARALQLGFQRFRNVTPITYLRNYRLEVAHAQLKAGADRGWSVTDVALNVGFNHLSKFTRDYRARYGVLPSATLRQI